MNISEVINTLVEIKSEYGDLECYVLCDYLKKIAVIEEPDTRPQYKRNFVQILLKG